jgi:hypothetical protein
VDELSKIIHPTEAPAIQSAPVLAPAEPEQAIEAAPKNKTIAAPKAVPTPPPARRKTPRGKAGKRNLDAPPSEKVIITVDLAKDLYKRMKIQLVEEEIDISSYVRDLIERDLSRK